MSLPDSDYKRVVKIDGGHSAQRQQPGRDSVLFLLADAITRNVGKKENLSVEICQRVSGYPVPALLNHGCYAEKIPFAIIKSISNYVQYRRPIISSYR